MMLIMLHFPLRSSIVPSLRMAAGRWLSFVRRARLVTLGWFVPCFLLLVPAWPWAAEPSVVIKFSHVVAPDTPKGKAAQRFKEIAEKLSQGRIRVEVYPNSQLYRDRDELEALQLGLVQMLAPSLAKFDQLGLREFEVFDLPFVFPSRQALRRVTEGAVGQELLQHLESKGIKGLAYWDNGFKILSANRALRVPADMKGLRMRIQPSQVLAAQMRTLGALPQELAFSATTSALKTGLVDGTENPPSNFWTQGMCAYQANIVVSYHGYLGYAVIVNKKFWEDLPRDLRQILEHAMHEATQYANEIAQAENDADLQKIRSECKTKVVDLSDADRKLWMDALRPVQVQMANRVGNDLLVRVQREAAR